MELFILLFMYFVPNVIAFYRQHQCRWLILLINLLIAWTLIGWVICLLWSCGRVKVPDNENNNDRSTGSCQAGGVQTRTC
jgi:Superinfection immunity protein